MVYFSETTMGFYDSRVHPSLPGDAVEITEEQYNAVMNNPEGLGWKIVADENGLPKLQAPPLPSVNDTIKAQIAALEAQQTPRRIRDAIAGTDNGWLANLEGQVASLRATLTAE